MKGSEYSRIARRHCQPSKTGLLAKKQFVVFSLRHWYPNLCSGRQASGQSTQSDAVVKRTCGLNAMKNTDSPAYHQKQTISFYTQMDCRKTTIMPTTPPTPPPTPLTLIQAHYQRIVGSLIDSGIMVGYCTEYCFFKKKNIFSYLQQHGVEYPQIATRVDSARCPKSFNFLKYYFELMYLN